MQTALDNKPDDKNIGDEHFQDLVNRNWSPDEQRKLSDEAGDGSENSGADSSRGSSKKSLSPSDVAKNEASAASPAANQAESKESDDTIGGGFRDEGSKKSRRFRLTRRQAVTGGVTGILIGGAFGLFSILHGPLQIIHFAQLLQKFHFSVNEDFMDGRAGRYLRYGFSGNAERARLGFVRDKIASRVEARLQNNSGVRSIYSDPPNRRLIGYEVIDSAKAHTFIDSMAREGVNVNGAPRGSGTGNNTTPPDTNNRFIDLEVDSRGNDIRNRRKVTRAAVKSTGHYKIASRYASRLLIKRGGVDFHPLKNKKRAAGENLVKYYDDRKKERSERRKRGVDPPNKRLAGHDTDNDGTTDTDATAQEANDFVNDASGAETPESRLRVAGRLAGGAAALVGAVCIINDISDGIDEYKYTNIILVMMRMGMEIVTTGNQTMSNMDMNIDELGSIVTDLYDEDAAPGEESWAAARSIQYENNQQLTGPDLPASSKPGAVGEKPPLFQAVSDTPGVSGICGLQEKAESIPIIGAGLILINQVGEAFINAALSTFGTSIEEIFDGIVRVFAGEVVNTYAKGAELGNIANTGALLAANDQAIAMGGRELDDNEVQELDQLARLENQREFASLSLYERVFNVYRVDSLAATIALKTPKSPRQAARTFASIPGSLFSGLTNLGFKLAGADSHDGPDSYDYGFSEFGFSAAEQDDQRFENPFENAEIMEANNNQRLREANEKYGECFSMKINPDTGEFESGEGTRYEEINSNPNCKDGSENLLRFRFYLADLIAAHTLACNEGIETSCVLLGFGNTPVVQGDPSSGEAPSGDTQSLAQQILDNPNITYPLDAISPNGSTKEVLQALANGQPAPVDCTGGRPGNRTTTTMNPNVLKFVLEYGQQAKVGVNSLTDKCHSANSRHYIGGAVDFECSGVPFEVSRGDTIATKYGGKRNGETCSANSHWHYNF